MDKLRVSVVIPTLNRAETLRISLNSYMIPEVKEIVVVDDCSRDNTKDVVDGFSRKLDKSFIYVKNKRRLGSPSSRNIGIEASNEEYILMGEDDVVLADDYIKVLSDAMEEVGASVAAGQCIATNSVPEKQCIEEFVQLSADRFEKKRKLPFEALTSIKSIVETPDITAIALFKKEVFNEAHYDESFSGNAFREETDLYYRVLRGGKKLIFVRDALCFHLRGAYARSGGQRANSKGALINEAYSIVNSFRFIDKNWDTIYKVHKPKIRNANAYKMVYFANREWVNLQRITEIILRNRARWL